MTDDWRVKRDCIYAADGSVVAVVFDGQPAGTRPEDEREIARRAALIAAAPDLLDALERCLDLLTNYRTTPGGYERVLALAKLALKRAVPEEEEHVLVK